MAAMNIWPTDGAAGSVANEARWRAMARHWAPSGIAAGVANEMVPTLAFPNLTVQAGAAWVDGHWCELTSPQVLTATANGLAVVRVDPVANTAELLWRDGATTPTQVPTGTWELPIARTVGSVLTDLRVNSLTQSQTIPRFASASARSSRIPQPVLNQLTILDTRPGIVQFWNGAAWVDTNSTVPVPPAYVDPLLHQFGTTVGTTNGFGWLTIPLPAAFANVSYRAVVINGDGDAMTPLYSFWCLLLAGGKFTNSFAIAACWINGEDASESNNPVADTTIRVDWITVGARP